MILLLSGNNISIYWFVYKIFNLLMYYVNKYYQVFFILFIEFIINNIVFFFYQDVLVLDFEVFKLIFLQK